MAMYEVPKRSRLALLAGAACAAIAFGHATPGVADDKNGDDGDKKVVIDASASGPSRSLYPLAVPLGVDGDSSAAKGVHEVLAFNMAIAGWFKVVEEDKYKADLDAEGLKIDAKDWKKSGAFGVLKYKVTVSGDDVELVTRIYEIEKGEDPVFSKTYKGTKSKIRKLVHIWSNDVVMHFTGEPGFFGSKIAYVTGRKKGKVVGAMDFDGHGQYSISNNKSINILPAWSPDGSKIAFTSYMRDNPDLYVASAGGGRPKRIAKYEGMNTGATWSPDGSKIALTLSKDGNAEIYVIDSSDGSIIKRLTDNPAIDTSPAWSPDGGKIAFVSDREGGPQIFVMSSSGGGAKRVSSTGSYNTTPAWSKQAGKEIIAYTTRDGAQFDIVVKDLGSGKMTRITQGQGNNEEPTFSPNGRVIAFASTRDGGGVYLANADGSGQQRKVKDGSATSLDWGPAPKQ